MEKYFDLYFLGLPLVAWGGLFTITVLTATFLTGLKKAPLVIHRRLAYTTITLALIHGLIGLILTIF